MDIGKVDILIPENYTVIKTAHEYKNFIPKLIYFEINTLSGLTIILISR